MIELPKDDIELIFDMANAYKTSNQVLYDRCINIIIESNSNKYYSIYRDAVLGLKVNLQYDIDCCYIAIMKIVRYNYNKFIYDNRHAIVDKFMSTEYESTILRQIGSLCSMYPSKSDFDAHSAMPYLVLSFSKENDSIIRHKILEKLNIVFSNIGVKSIRDIDGLLANDCDVHSKFVLNRIKSSILMKNNLYKDACIVLNNSMQFVSNDKEYVKLVNDLMVCYKSLKMNDKYIEMMYDISDYVHGIDKIKILSILYQYDKSLLSRLKKLIAVYQLTNRNNPEPKVIKDICTTLSLST